METLNPSQPLEILCLLLTAIVVVQEFLPPTAGKTLWQRPQLAHIARFDRRDETPDRRRQQLRMLNESRRTQRRTNRDAY